MTFDSESAEAADDDYHIEDHHCYNEDRHDNNDDDDSAVCDSESAAATAAALPWEQQTSSNSCLHHGDDDNDDHDNHLNHNKIKLTMMMDDIYSRSETIFKGGENLVLHRKKSDNFDNWQQYFETRVSNGNCIEDGDCKVKESLAWERKSAYNS